VTPEGMLHGTLDNYKIRCKKLAIKSGKMREEGHLPVLKMLYFTSLLILISSFF